MFLETNMVPQTNQVYSDLSAYHYKRNSRIKDQITDLFTTGNKGDF